MPADSKMELLLTKAKPISNSGYASRITDLQREKMQQHLERGVRICERKTDTKVFRHQSQERRRNDDGMNREALVGIQWPSAVNPKQSAKESCMIWYYGQ
ncbi:hypothetical protein WISP_109297 [Willisornis vidua]|uniref:Uncharacterized protein n=1 Tax=Willisornis vidua TaxID=1566151 RepID=A0ABQ9CW21_9PASS|nr:hypothetical protein WISP_109297 [Willisornis vidua]